MKFKTLFILLVIFSIYSGCMNRASDERNNSDTPQWENLFENGDVSQWHGDGSDSFPEAGWLVENNELILNSGQIEDSIRSGDIFTKSAYGDFEFYWEWKMLTVGGNSGVKYFVPGKGQEYADYGPGPEFQILDDDNHPWMLQGKMKPNDHYTMGSCYELYAADSTKAPAPIGQWNNSRIVSHDGHIEHWLNGKKIVEYNRYSEDFKNRVLNSKFKEFPKYGRLDQGHIMLQDHGSEIHFRNLKIKILDQ